MERSKELSIKLSTYLMLTGNQEKYILKEWCLVYCTIDVMFSKSLRIWLHFNVKYVKISIKLPCTCLISK